MARCEAEALELLVSFSVTVLVNFRGVGAAVAAAAWRSDPVGTLVPLPRYHCVRRPGSLIHHSNSVHPPPLCLSVMTGCIAAKMTPLNTIRIRKQTELISSKHVCLLMIRDSIGMRADDAGFLQYVVMSYSTARLSVAMQAHYFAPSAKPHPWVS